MGFDERGPVQRDCFGIADPQAAHRNSAGRDYEGQVDYMFFQSSGQLRCVGRLELPKLMRGRRLILPSHNDPSDHLPLLAAFSIGRCEPARPRHPARSPPKAKRRDAEVDCRHGTTG